MKRCHFNYIILVSIGGVVSCKFIVIYHDLERLLLASIKSFIIIIIIIIITETKLWDKTIITMSNFEIIDLLLGIILVLLTY